MKKKNACKLGLLHLRQTKPTKALNESKGGGDLFCRQTNKAVKKSPKRKATDE